MKLIQNTVQLVHKPFRSIMTIAVLSVFWGGFFYLFTPESVYYKTGIDVVIGEVVNPTWVYALAIVLSLSTLAGLTWGLKQLTTIGLLLLTVLEAFVFFCYLWGQQLAPGAIYALTLLLTFGYGYLFVNKHRDWFSR